MFTARMKEEVLNFSCFRSHFDDERAGVLCSIYDCSIPPIRTSFLCSDFRNERRYFFLEKHSNSSSENMLILRNPGTNIGVPSSGSRRPILN